MNSTAQRVLELKEHDQDFEWYPTTDEIIEVVAADIQDLSIYMYGDAKILDVGAGDGRVLTAIAKKVSDNTSHKSVNAELFAIEKAIPHLSAMPKNIVVLGTDFMQQMIVDKQMTFTFSNPPYSEYETWMNKLIRESSTQCLYLVVPIRWRNSDEIAAALESRDVEAETLGEFDFENADRKARAKVEVIKIWFGNTKNGAFDAAIEDMLPELEVFDRIPEDDGNGHVDRACQLIDGEESLIASLVKAYDAELNHLVDNYRNVTKLDMRVLKELGVTKEGVLIGIREKIIGLKCKYWGVLFDRLTPITQRLATKQRKEFLESLNGKATIDFTESNIYSMMIWLTKWSNDFFDEQLIQLFRKMSEHCNVVNYKSNHNVWEKGNWRYMDENKSHYLLEYRIVVERCGGICTSQWQFENKRGLSETAFDFIRDIVTVANNLGFASEDSPQNYEWRSNKQNNIQFSDGKTLVAVRAFKNGNMHMHFNPKLMLAINVEAGRLLGWIRNADDAVNEMQATGDDAAYIKQKFGSSFRIAPTNTLRLN